MKQKQTEYWTYSGQKYEVKCSEREDKPLKLTHKLS